MVWGLRLPNDFGQFWPSGEFEFDPKANDSGWYDRLRTYYLAQTPEEQIRLYDYRRLEPGRNTVEDAANQYRTYVPSKFTIELGKKDPGLHHLPVTSVEAHEVPRTFVTDKAYKSLGSFLKLNDKIIAVDECLKDIIEKIEPNTHEFFHIEMKRSDGGNLAQNFFILVIRQYFESFQPEKSDRHKKNFSGLVFSKDIHGGSHLWKDRGTPALVYFSDELKVKIDKAGLSIPRSYKMKEL
jgi:hypothetical protein